MSAEISAQCSVDFDFEQYRFPGFPVPAGETPFSYLETLCPRGCARGITRSSPRSSSSWRTRWRSSSAPAWPSSSSSAGTSWSFCRERGIPGAGPGYRRRLDRRLRAGHHARRPDPPQAAVRALHQRGPHLVPGRRHRLRLVAPRGGHPVPLRALRRGAHGHGLQPRHLPGAVGGARGGLCARLSAAAGRSRGEGARDVRQRRWSGATWRPRAASPSSSRRHPRSAGQWVVGVGGRVGGVDRSLAEDAASSTRWAAQRRPSVRDLRSRAGRREAPGRGAARHV